MLLKMRGTVSTLCANTSGAASNTCCSSSGRPLKSGTRISTPVWVSPSEFSSWVLRIVSAYSHAPPSARSSRATPVIVA